MLPGTAALPILTRWAPIIIGNDFCQAPREPFVDVVFVTPLPAAIRFRYAALHTCSIFGHNDPPTRE